MQRVLIADNGKKVVVNVDTDVCLYSSPCNPPNTGTDYTRGTDLFAHKARSGNMYFYLKHWSLWQNEGGGLELIGRGEAQEFLERCAGYTGVSAMDESDFARAKECGFDLLEETA